MKKLTFTTTARIASALLLSCILPGLNVRAVNEALINRKADGGRAQAAHRINLKDADGSTIAFDDLHPQPFSTRQTCGECHNYDKISQGWHFNAGTTSTQAAQPGHAGEPWILSDPITKTQLPISLRAWPGAWKPEKIGMTPWRFIKAFGSHLPGGGIADVDADSTAALDNEARWTQAGGLEVNCLACHNGSADEDMSEFAAQVANGNLKWAATAASGLGTVDGAVKTLPAWYDPALGQPLDDPDAQAPRVAYRPAYFDKSNRAYLNIKGKPDASRCYFCHSTAHSGKEAEMSDEDVHMKAGLTCVDCHRNGIEHQILRGGEDDPILKEKPEAIGLTCKGCHLGDEATGTEGGRMRAPRPKHKGLPPVHLERMSCTACHSGAIPEKQSGEVRTSRAHKLGTRTKGELVMPYIETTVFEKIGGKTKPCNIVWPAFWGVMKGNDVTPLLPEKVIAATGTMLVETDNGTTGTEDLLTSGKVVKGLKALAATLDKGSEPVYVSGGKLHKLGPEGKLAALDHESAKPYAWPIAHEVRPASQALGAKGCAECHTEGAPFFFGAVKVADTLTNTQAVEVKMSEFEKISPDLHLDKLTCVQCHREEEKALATGLHKPDGKSKMPTCTDCHGPMTTTFGADGLPTHGTTGTGANRSAMVTLTSAHGTTVTGANRSFIQARQMVAACSSCHQGQHKELKADPVETYKENVHGTALLKKGKSQAAICSDCHGTHAMLPAKDPKSTLNPLNVPKTCGRCHEGVADIFYSSIHGQTLLAGKKNAATCTSCHSSHGIGPVNKPFLVGMVKECSTCHLKRGETYLTSYHGKATSLGSDSPAVCSSCHGSHEIMPASNTASMVAPVNLVKTCGQCHQDVNKNFVKYMPHNDMRDPNSSKPVYLVFLGMSVLLLGTMGFFVPHTLLWFQRSLWDRLRNPQGYHLKAAGERRIQRFSLLHRILHVMVIVSFMGLVATGFPLKYSSTDWAKSLATVLGGVHVMGIIHRVMAIITFAYFGIHLGFLGYFFAFKCPTSRIKFLFGPDSLIPTLRDVKDFFAMLRWFLWLGPRPKLDRWVYFEKFDYWAVFWGVSVIGCSGLILWMPSLFTRWLPGWIVNCATVVHSHEALLAAAFIFLIHFFHTHVRMEKFPIDMTMMTGSATEEEMKEEHGAYYERLVDSGKLEEHVVAPVALHWRVLGAIAGLAMFGLGTWLIVLALKTELGHFFH